ncbi:MAG: hypothetical protein ACRC68_01205 [Clostridium sp.]
MSKVKVLGVKNNSFVASTGELIDSAAVWFIDDSVPNSDKQFGIEPIMVKVPYSSIDNELKNNVPCYANIEFGMRPGKYQKSEACINSIVILEPLVL